MHKAYTRGAVCQVFVRVFGGRLYRMPGSGAGSRMNWRSVSERGGERSENDLPSDTVTEVQRCQPERQGW